MKTNFYFNWCIENDYQVYIKPDGPHYRIAIRNGGITTEGKNSLYVDGIERTSSEVLGSVRYKTGDAAAEKLTEVYKYLYDAKVQIN